MSKKDIKKRIRELINDIEHGADVGAIDKVDADVQELKFFLSQLEIL